VNESPVTVRAQLDEPLSRGLWLVKWLLAIPHFIILVFLWIAFIVVWVISFFAILFTGRYPQGLFDFNVGVLRWTWRVGYYTYNALGTDKYPPFSLADDPAYPAGLTVEYPETLSRGLVLVKWWLLAIPHYLIVAVFIGGGGGGNWSRWNGDDRRDRDWDWGWDGGWGWGWDSPWGGLIMLCVLIAAIALLFTARYPRGLYDLIMGMNRWGLRVAAYVALMTDTYPPFRLDQGGTERSTSETARPDIE
jgi:hypothetical protein